MTARPESRSRGLAQPPSGREVLLLGCRIDALSFPETLDEVERLVMARAPVQHCVVNASKIVLMQRDERLRRILATCPLVNADGQSVVWAARLLGMPLPERVTGIDLFTSLLQLAEVRGFGVYFFGASRKVIEETVAKARARHPDLRICGWHDGYTRLDDVVVSIRESRPDILFVGMPSPAKEYWLADNLERMNVPFSMGVGGSFDVYAGKVTRAPRWMQRMGLEWVYRFAQEPRRLWKRYLIGNAEFLLLVAGEMLSRRHGSRLPDGDASQGSGAAGAP